MNLVCAPQPRPNTQPLSPIPPSAPTAQPAGAPPPAMTTPRSVSTSLARLSYTPTSPFPKSLGRDCGRVLAFPARPRGFSLRLRSSTVMAAAGVGGNGSPAAPGDSTGTLRGWIVEFSHSVPRRVGVVVQLCSSLNTCIVHVVLLW